MSEHVLEASGVWTSDGSSTASVACAHPRCAFWTNGYNEDYWPGYDWDGSKPLAAIVSEAQAAHDSWLASRPVVSSTPRGASDADQP